MTVDRMMEEIREVNLAYLLLAQQMLREDKISAAYRLGLTQDVAESLDSLTPAQLLNMASSNLLLCRFRLEDRNILDMLTGYCKNKAMPYSHAAILMAGQQPATAVA